MSEYFLQVPFVQNITIDPPSICNVVSTVDYSNFDCYNIEVYNAAKFDSNVQILGNVVCAQNLTASNIVVTLLTTSNLIFSNLYVSGGYYTSSGLQVIDSNGFLTNAVLTGSNATFLCPLLAQSNIYAAGSYFCSSNGASIRVIDQYGNISINQLNGASNGTSVEGVINTASAAFTAVSTGLEAGTDIYSAFKSMGSLFGDGTKTAAEAVQAAEQTPDGNGNTPYSGGSNYVSWSPNVINVPFQARGGTFAINNNLVIGDSYFIQAGITTGWSTTMGNTVFSGSVVNVIDVANQFFYANLVQFAGLSIDNYGIHRSNVNTSNFYFDSLVVNGSNLFANTVSCTYLDSLLNTSLYLSTNCNLLISASNISRGSINVFDSNANTTISSSNLFFVSAQSNVIISTPSNGIYISAASSNISISTGSNIVKFTQSNMTTNGVVIANSNVSCSGFYTSNNNSYIGGSLFVQGGVYSAGLVQIGGGFLTASNNSPGLYGINGTRAWTSIDNQFYFSDSLNAQALQSGKLMNNRVNANQPAVGNPFLSSVFSF